MQQDTRQLIDELLKITEWATATAGKFRELSTAQLNYRQQAGSWSILECIEHLNLYGDYYLPEIQKQMLSSTPSAGPRVFKSGWLGNYFANLMKAVPGTMKKMKSPKDKNPINAKLTITTIDRFLKQQEMLKSLLLQASGCDLVKTKTAISLSRFVRLRLGDTFRFFVYHIERHVMQAQRLVIAGNAGTVPTAGSVLEMAGDRKHELKDLIR